MKIKTEPVSEELINPTIFRAYDIRGLAPEELNIKTAELIGLAFGNFLENLAKKKLNPKVKKVLISRDHRRTGIEIKRGLIRGLMKAGMHVVDIGISSTPEFYYAVCKHKFNAGCQITASHNPKNYNGIKLQLKNALPLSGETGIYEIRDMIEKGHLNVKKLDTVLKTEHLKVNVRKEYINYLIKKCEIKRKLKIIIDTGNGVVGKVPEKVLKKLGCKVKTLYAKPDDTFPNHIADPHNSSTLKDLQEEVLKRKADLGIAFDGDGDRLGIIDNKGKIVGTDKILMMLARKALAKRKGTVVYAVRVSRAVIEDTKAHGGKVIISKAGHSYVLEKIMNNKAVFGGELSGHIFYPIENYPYDDAMFSSLKIVEIVSSLDDFSSYVQSLPSYSSSPEIQIKSTEENKFKQIKKFIQILKAKGYKVNTIDGAKVDLDNGWALVRASNTAPYIKCRFEGETKKDLQQIINKIQPLMAKACIKLKKFKI